MYKTLRFSIDFYTIPLEDTVYTVALKIWLKIKLSLMYLVY